MLKKSLIAALCVLCLLSIPLGVRADDGDDASVNITTEVLPPPSSPWVGGSGGISSYTAKTDLFGTEGSFSISYYGEVLSEIEVTSGDGSLTVTIPENTIALGVDGKRLKTLTVLVDENPPRLPEDTCIVGLPYTFEPCGATFSPPMTLTWSYDSSVLPEGVVEEDLVLAYYDGTEWIELSCVVDTENNTITASVSHFTTFAIIGRVVFIEPEVVEPEVIEPEITEPEIIEPEVPAVTEPELEPSKPGVSWVLVWSIVGSVVLAVLVVTAFVIWRKRRKV